MNLISIFIPSLRGGGAERMMVVLANEFSEKGYNVDLIVAEKKGPYVDIISPNVNIINFGTRKILRSLFPLFLYLRKTRPDVLISAMTHVNIIAICARMLSNVKTKIIVSERNALTFGKSKLSKYFFIILIKLFYPYSDSIIAVSDGVAFEINKLLSRKKKKALTIYNPLVSHDIITKMNFPVKHPWLNNKGADSFAVIIAMGRLTEQKRFQILIRAINLVREKNDIKLIILGEGEDRDKLERLVDSLGLGGIIDMPGFANNPFAFIKRADLFVLSSAWEGLPGVLVQAMACGVPVVSTDCPHGPSEILENGKWGRLVPVNDFVALADAIVLTLNDGTHPDVVSRANSFSVDNAVNNYLNVMDL